MSNVDIIRKELLLKNDSNKHGTWEIIGFNSLSDVLSDSEILKRVDGIYSDVVDYAMSLDRFIIHNTYGYINEVSNIKTIFVDADTLRKKKELEDKKQYLEDQLEKVVLELMQY